MHNQRSFDPMAAFLGGGDDVSGEKGLGLMWCSFKLQSKKCHHFTFVPQVLEKPKDKKDKSGGKHSRR